MKKTPTIKNLKKRVAELSQELFEINRELYSITTRYENNHDSAVSGKDFLARTGGVKIIPFPGLGYVSDIKNKQNHSKPVIPYSALPGISLPPEIPDFRPSLQRDGLILLGWDMRDTEAGERYTAYWVTSTGTARFYASRQYEAQNFSSAQPDHKSYAAEDGIEFYGQANPAYIVHTAPELMMSNPRHGELRASYIKKLKKQGINVDFMYKYLLTYEKYRAVKKPERAGA